jgi:hypothetical protein
MYNRAMWRSLPLEGQPLSELRIEGNGTDRDVVIVPRTGELVRFPSAGEVMIETNGRVLSRATGIDGSMRVTFSGDLVLEHGQVRWNDGEAEWQALWRRARTRSRPWWYRAETQEIELDLPLDARFVLVGKPGSPSPAA